MPHTNALQLSAVIADQVLTPQQKRFNTLVRQIEQTRQGLALWQDSVATYRQAYAKEVVPLQASLTAARRAWAFALDGLFDQADLTRAESATLSELVRLTASDLLHRKDDDAALRALFAKHSDVDFDTERQRQLQATAEIMEIATGLDIDDIADIKTDDDLMERLQRKLREEEAAAEAAQAARAAKSAQRRKSPAQQRREDETQLTTQLVREIFRKLASALHPDRETDPAQREAKTALMQRVNQAYAANDLLTLLQLQLHIEQVDVAHIANAGADKLQRYNKILAEQLTQLKQEMRKVEADFCVDFGLPTDEMLSARKLSALIKQDKRLLNDHLTHLRQEMRMLADHGSAKRWLKRQRQLLSEAASDFDFY